MSEIFKESLIQVIMAGVGALGFSIYFRVSEKNVIASTFGGALGWAIYLLFDYVTNSLFLSTFVATLIVFLYSQLMGKIVLKSPTSVFLVPGVIPMIPGGALYYMMSGLVEGDNFLFVSRLKQTGVITFGIAAGIIFGTVIMIYVQKLKQKNT